MASLLPLTMEEMFFPPSTVLLDRTKRFVRGAVFQEFQEIDTLVHDKIRHFLFSTVVHEVSFGLIAFYLQRSRDHALPSYNDTRQRFTDRRARTFADTSPLSRGWRQCIAALWTMWSLGLSLWLKNTFWGLSGYDNVCCLGMTSLVACVIATGSSTECPICFLRKYGTIFLA